MLICMYVSYDTEEQGLMGAAHGLVTVHLPEHWQERYFCTNSYVQVFPLKFCESVLYFDTQFKIVFTTHLTSRLASGASAGHICLID
jgi:hypothetical protein